MITLAARGGLPALPIPVPDGMPTWLVNALFIAAAAAVFVVLLWQAVRYFRQNRDDDHRRTARGREGCRARLAAQSNIGPHAMRESPLGTVRVGTEGASLPANLSGTRTASRRPLWKALHSAVSAPGAAVGENPFAGETLRHQ